MEIAPVFMILKGSSSYPGFFWHAWYHGEGFGAQQALPVAAGEPGGWILPMLGSEAGTQKHSGALGCAWEQETQRCPGDLGGNSSFWRQALPG